MQVVGHSDEDTHNRYTFLTSEGEALYRERMADFGREASRPQ